MDRRRAAGLLLALAACFATATAAPTASNHTALDLYDGAPDGCYYNFQHYGEGDRIMTNEPCLNCTCHHRMLMCYLRVCPFTKPIGQDCTIEKRADQCCPIVTCPDVPVDLLTSTTTSPAEYGPTGIGKLEKFGCSINGKYFSEGSKVPPTPNKPCEHCYCIRNMTTCVMQECTLHVDGCTPIYHKDVCCPVRYSCDHPEDGMPLLDDLSTTVRPTPGFLLTTTTVSPVTQISQDCVYDNRIFPDGALIKTEKACDHCYCMKGDIVCVVQECGTPMENEGKNCTASSPREGVCCPDTYICEGDEPSTGTYEIDESTTRQEKLTTLSPPRRTSSEGSGYRIEPDEAPYTESSVLEPEVEGSGEDDELKQPDEITTKNPKPESTDDILASTEEAHEFITLTTTKPKEDESTQAEVSKDDSSTISTKDIEKSTEPQQRLPSTTGFYSTQDFEESITGKTEDIGSGEEPEQEKVSVTPVSPDKKENVATTEIYEENIITSGFTEPEPPRPQVTITSAPLSTDEKTDKLSKEDAVTNDIVITGFTEREPSEPQLPVTSAPFSKEELTDIPSTEDASNAIGILTTSISTIEHDITTTTIPVVEKSTKIPYSTEPSQISEETATKNIESFSMTTVRTPIIEEEVKETTKPTDLDTGVTDDFSRDITSETPHYASSTSASSLDDKFVTTEAQELSTDLIKEKIEFIEPQHVTASTPMLEEIEKDTTENIEPDQDRPISGTQDNTFSILSTTMTSVPVKAHDKDVTESTVYEEHISEDYLPGTTNIPILDQQEQITTGYEYIPKAPIDGSIKDFKPEEHSFSTTITDLIDNERNTTPDFGIAISEYDSERHDSGINTPSFGLETDETTTEPDRGLNTIPSEGIEEGIPVPEDQTATTNEEKITTAADLSHNFSTETEDMISSTITDTSISKEEEPWLTTVSAFRKEDYSPTEAQASPEMTIVTAGVTKEVTSTLTHDHTESTKFVPDQHRTDTTLVPNYTESFEETTLAKEITDIPKYETSTPKALVTETYTETSTTSISLQEKETATANQEDNEIFNEPRIPGEGDCLLNGVTYTNESAVPNTNKCQSGCKCVNSIIKCYPTICSPPPEYMNNCETTYDTPEACCPTYICDHKTETIPPQSHSQMSGTEAPVISPVYCQGNECQISVNQTQHDKHSDACKSGNCLGPSDETKEITGYPISENISENSTVAQNEECVGNDCTQALCTDKNGCQVTPVQPQPCDGEKCETSPHVILPPEIQQCAFGEDCAVSSITDKQCIGDTCDTSTTQLEGTHPTEICTGKEGCHNIPQLPEDKCKDDHCRRKDQLDQHVGEPCTTPDCKQSHISNETSIDQQGIDEDHDRNITNTTEILESVTKSPEHSYSGVTSGLPDTHDIVTKQPEITQEESLTTISDIIELVTKPKPEITTEYIDEQDGDTNGDILTEKNDLSSTQLPEYQLPVSTETTKKDSNEYTSPPLDGMEVEITDKPITQQAATDTESPQEYEPIEKTTSEKASDVTEPTKIYTSETQETEPTELKPADDKLVFPEESSTEPSVAFTMEPHEMTKPSEDNKDKIDIDIVMNSNTEVPKSQEGTIKPDIMEHVDTTIVLTHERSTEPSRTFPTESDGIVGAPQKTEPGKSTTSSGDKPIENVPQSSTQTIINDTNEQVGETDDTKTVSEPSEYVATTVSAITDSYQGITVSKSPDATEHKDISSESAETTSMEPPKSFITESLSITESSESIDQDVTTQKVLEKSSTEPSSYYTKEPHATSLSQESHKITADVYETVTESETVPKGTQTETQFDTKSPNEIDLDGVTITDTKTTQSYATEPKTPENQVETTSKVAEESSSEPPKTFDTKDQPITQSSEKSDHNDSTQNIHEESSETSVTDLHQTPGEVDQNDTASEIPDKSVTEPIKQQEESKPYVDTDEVATTDKVLGGSGTEPPKYFDAKPNVSDLLEENTETKITPETESPLSYATEPQDTSKSSDEPIATTVKVITESASEQTEAQDEIKDEHVTFNPVVTEEPFIESNIPEVTTTSQELSTSESEELTSLPPISDSKITTLHEEILKETTDAGSYDSETKPPQTVGTFEIETSEKELISTTSVPIDHNIAITATTLSSDSDQTKYAESTPKPMEQETQKPTSETQTISPPTSLLEEISQTDVGATKQPVKEATTETDIPHQTKVPAFVPTESDNIRTTSSEAYDLTTLKTIDASQLPDEEKIEAEYTEVSMAPQQEQNIENKYTVLQESSTEKILTGTEKLAIPEIMSTEPAPEDSTGNLESETEPSQINSETGPSIQENYTDEPIREYSLPEQSGGYDLTTVYADENTLKPIYHDSKKPESPVDDVIQSLVTEQYETDTKQSDFEKGSQSPTPTQIASVTPEIDVKQTPQQNIIDETSTLSSTSADTTLKELNDKVVMTTEYDKPATTDIRTESPFYVDKVETETTTVKKQMSEDVAVTQEPSAPKHTEFMTSTTSEHISTTERADMTEIDATTESKEAMNDVSLTEKQELASSDNPYVDLDESHTESLLEITKGSDVQTESTKAVSTELPDMVTSIQVPTSKPISEEYDSNSEDLQTTETLDPGKKKLEPTPLEPSSDAGLSTPLESTTAPKQEYPVDSSSLSEEEHTDKIIEDSTKTTVAGEFTTESASSERYTEKQPDTLETEFPEKASSVEEVDTTRKPEVYQTTTSGIEVTDDMSSQPSIALEEGSTTLTQDIEQRPPTIEQSIPVVISETEKSLTPEESIAVQTEKVILASEKPLQETTAPEEEFIIATSTPTTAKSEGEMYTLYQSPDRTDKPIATSGESHSTTAPDTTITIASKGPISIVPEETNTMVPDAFISSTPEAPVTKIPEVHEMIETDAPVTTESEILATMAPEAFITNAFEAPITSVPETSITNAPETPITGAPIMPETLDTHKAPITNASEVSTTSSPESTEVLISSAPESTFTPAPKAPITSGPEAITEGPEALITSAPVTFITEGLKAPIASEPETFITEGPKATITSAPEAHITEGPEVPLTSAPEAHITEGPEAPITSAPEAHITARPVSLITSAPETFITEEPKVPITNEPETHITAGPEAPITSAPEANITEGPEAPITSAPEAHITEGSEASITSAPETHVTEGSEAPITSASVAHITEGPEAPITNAPVAHITEGPKATITSAPELHITEGSTTSAPEAHITEGPEATTSSTSEAPVTKASEAPITSAPEAYITKGPGAPISSDSDESFSNAPEAPITSAPESPLTYAPKVPVTAAPELPKPASTEAQPTDEAPTPDEDGSFPPSGGTSGYGQEPDYVEEDQTFGPGTCRYGGKVYVSAQQIPRDDPCDFCFCFRSDIICLQQSCPPPIHGCHEEPIQGFCCPRYECPVSMATTVNVTTTTTTTTTTLPPHFPTHSYKGSVQKRGCQIKGQTYKVGEVVRASSGPCLHCTCGGDGQMKCDPKVCTPEPMLRQMIAAAVSAKRRR